MKPSRPPITAIAIGEKLTHLLIRRLQRLDPGVLADEGAANLWDEICVQIQRGSDFRSAYEDEMEAHLGIFVAQLPEAERRTIWMSTYDGGESAPVNDRAIARHVMGEHIPYQVGNYENERIRRMLQLD